MEKKSVDLESTDESSRDGFQMPSLTSFHPPPKKLKKQDFNLCLICNTTKISKLHRWTESSWDTFCTAARRKQDETFARLETFILNREHLPVDLSELWKHADCYSNYKNPKTVDQKERIRLRITTDQTSRLIKQEPSTSGPKSNITTRSQVPKRSDDKRCLICNKERKWLSQQKKHERLMKITLASAGDAIIRSAKNRNDEHILREIGPMTEGADIIAKDIVVHNSCRAAYTSKRNICFDQSQNLQPTIYESAFQAVVDVVQQRVIDGKEVLQIRDLLHQRNSILESHNCASTWYRPCVLKARLQNKFGSKVAFWSPQNCKSSEVIYSTDVPDERVLQNEIEVTIEKDKGVTKEEDGVHEDSYNSRDEFCHAFTTSLRIHHDIQDVPQLQWPPRPEHMSEENIRIPNSLYNCLAWVLQGAKSNEGDVFLGKSGSEFNWTENRVETPVNIHRKILSIGQDIVHAATNSRIMTVKHVLLAKTIQQKTGSMSLVSLLNHQQHSINRCMLQEMDTANAELILSESDLGYHMPQGMVPNTLPVFGWDNNDFKNRGHFSGSCQVHDSTGYMAQPRLNHMDKIQETDDVSKPKTRRRSIKPAEQTIQPCIISKKADPQRYVDAAKQLSEINSTLEKKASEVDFAWKLTRLNVNLSGNVKPEDQKVPGWKGFNRKVQSTIHASEKANVMPHRIGYCQTIHQSPDNNVIYTFLSRSVEMTDKIMDSDHGKGSCSVQIAVDMGIWFKAIQVILNKQRVDPRMNRIVLHQGPFHTAMRFLSCPGFLFGSAGLRDIFIEANILAEGSVDRVLKGEHWERGLYAHCLAAEAFHRRRFMSFVEHIQDSSSWETFKSDIDRLRNNISSDTLGTVLETEAFKEILMRYNEFITSLGPNGKFWSCYIDMIDILLRHIRASRTGDWQLHINTELEMLPWYFACGRTVYARHKPLYLLMMLNLSETHADAEEELMNGNLFTIQKSTNPFARIPADQETEMGVNRDSKSPGGISAISMNPAATLKWEVLSTQRAEFVRRIPVLTGAMADGPCTADDAGESRIRRDEEQIQLIMNTIEKWYNPFKYVSEPLCHIASGRQASQDVADDLLNAYVKGKEALREFATQRLQSTCTGDGDGTTQQQTTDSTKGFYDKLPKLALKNFESMIKPKKRTVKGQTFTLQYTRDLFHKMAVIAMDRGLSTDEVLKFPLGPLPYSLATETGGLAKTCKSVLMQELEKSVDAEETPIPTTHQVLILDAMALIQSLKLSHNATFGDLAEVIMNIIMKQVSSTNTSAIHWVCDTYPVTSIKNAERHTRMESADGSFATRITHANQKVDKQLKKALRDGQFKESLAEFLTTEWTKPKYARILDKHILYATSGPKCYVFRSRQELVKCEVVSDLAYNMEEADQRLILHARYASLQVPKPDVVVIRSPDTDVMVLATAACGVNWIPGKCLFLTGTASKTRYINITAISAKLGESVCNGLIGAHPFTGCDTTAAFKGRGKMSVIWLLQHDDTFCAAMSMLGQSLVPTDELITSCEHATCILYSFNARSKTLQPVRTAKVNELRAIMFASGTSDPAKLPPCQSALRKKVLRANYQAYINRHCIIPGHSVPSPHGHGWIVKGPGELEIDWMDVQPAPSVVLGMTCCGCKGNCTSNQCGCRKNRLKCTGICTCSNDCNNQAHTVDDVDGLSEDGTQEPDAQDPIVELDMEVMDIYDEYMYYEL